ncbi:MAG: sarcosine oxidase subunit gamma [Hyphomicrobiales bacterium]
MANRTLELRSVVPELSCNSRIGSQKGPAGLVVSEMTGFSVVSIAARKGQSGSLQGVVKKLFKIELPTAPRRVEADGIAFLWAGPDQWIAITDMASHPDFDREMIAKLGKFASFTDQGDARTLIRVSGPASREVIATGVPLDLHPRAFRPDDVALTHASHIAVTIWQVDDKPTFLFAVARGFARSFWNWLKDAGSIHGIDVSPGT